MRDVNGLIEMFEADLARVMTYPKTKKVKGVIAQLQKHIAELYKEKEKEGCAK